MASTSWVSESEIEYTLYDSNSQSDFSGGSEFVELNIFENDNESDNNSGEKDCEIQDLKESNENECLLEVI